MNENEAIEVLYTAILWVDQENREMMIAEIRKTHGTEAAEQIEEWYKIHKINGHE